MGTFSGKQQRGAASATVDTERQLAEFIAQFHDDPYGYVMAVWPWGRETAWDGGPNPLKDKRGPEPWQRDFLLQLGEHIKANRDWCLMDPSFQKFVWRSARASGHGVGKSALVAWLIKFLMSTRPFTRGSVTANTAAQLETRTWPELGKWHAMSMDKHWFTWTGTSFYFAALPEDQRKNYMASAQTVSVENTEAFAGLHNEGKTVFIIMDEASGIEAPVYEVAEGAMTDGEAFMFLFGNPTRPDGPFFDCFDKHAGMYNLAHIDSRSVSHTNKNALNDIIKKYGEDSDQAKIRVYGQFPTQSFNGFIDGGMVKEAFTRELAPDNKAALIMGVDVAHYGNDESVIFFRQGRDARSRKPIAFQHMNTTVLADRINDIIMRERPDAVCIESSNAGVGVIDRLRDVYHIRVVSVHPGAKAADDTAVRNKRAELWYKLREWLYEDGCLEDDGLVEGIYSQLSKIQYTIHKDTGVLQLEDKDAYKSRTGQHSPDRADALAMTFAIRLAGRDLNNSRLLPGGLHARNHAITEYDELAL